MQAELIPHPTASAGAQAQVIEFERLAERAQQYHAEARSAGTRRAYDSEWRGFRSWCDARGLSALPASPQCVALWLAWRAEGAKVSTIQKGMSAIKARHKEHGYQSPTDDEAVMRVWAGVRRTRGCASVGKAPFVAADLRRALDAIPGGLLGLRDRALLTVGFLGAFRRSELVGLDVQDLEFSEAGVAIKIKRSKGDQEGLGQVVAVPFAGNPAHCPIRSLRAWLEAAAIQEGPIFRAVDRHGKVSAARLCCRAVANAVKRRAVAVGLDAAKLSGHSLRSGFATSAAKCGASLPQIMATTRHANPSTCLIYIKQASQFDDLAAHRIAL